jgi:hypothetical protein
MIWPQRDTQQTRTEMQVTTHEKMNNTQTKTRELTDSENSAEIKRSQNRWWGAKGTEGWGRRVCEGGRRIQSGPQMELFSSIQPTASVYLTAICHCKLSPTNNVWALLTDSLLSYVASNNAPLRCASAHNFAHARCSPVTSESPNGVIQTL